MAYDHSDPPDSISEPRRELEVVAGDRQWGSAGLVDRGVRIVSVWTDMDRRRSMGAIADDEGVGIIGGCPRS